MQEKLIQELKKEVKQIVEEAVTRKFIHADSTSITSLCAVVDAIVKDDCKRRAGGLLSPYDTETFLLKLSEVSPSTMTLLRKLTGTEVHVNTLDIHRVDAESEDEPKKLDSKLKRLNLDQCKLLYGKNSKFLWIRVALVEKLLAKIITSLVEHAEKFYENTAILADSVFGPLVANLLAGPCALDYSKMKTPDGRWTDPSANELVQRHRIHSGLTVRKRQISLEKPQLGRISPPLDEFVVAPSLAREHVESLHQNSTVTMLFGKNNVEVQPISGSEWFAGYLSLHQTPHSLLLKWTPNEVMSGSPDEQNLLKKNEAITIDTLDVVYVHLHHKGEAERVMVLISQDGVQRPPIRFPTLGSSIGFLECLESGLAPYGRLDPPLVNESGGRSWFNDKDQKNSKQTVNQDYVFRLVPSIPSDEIGFDSHLNFWTTSKPKSRKTKKLKKISERPKSRSTHHGLVKKRGTPMTRGSLSNVCLTMKHQILYRALNGWFSHVRHLSTVQKHLSSLVEPAVLTDTGITKEGLTRQKWCNIYKHGKLCSNKNEIARLVYYGGVEPELRDLVWPYLLGYYRYGSTLDEREEEDKSRVCEYNRLVNEWSNVESLIKTRTRASETDHDSTADSAGSKEDGLNEIEKDESIESKKETVKLTKNDFTNSDVKENDFDHDEKNTCSSQHNGNHEEIVSEHNRITQENTSVHDENIDGSTSPKSDLDNESGCYDCFEETGEKFSFPRFSIVNGDVGITNGYHGSGDSECEVNQGDVREYKSCDDEHDHSICTTYSDDLLDNFGINVHRIDKDVLRCDRNYPYFTNQNLEKLRRIMCTYVWKTLDVGYIQGMCDLLAPLLVVFDDEVKSYYCFVLLMRRMNANFPHGGNMDNNFANMRSLIQILDPELFEVMQQNGDLTQCYFCYRWFLLDFKREFLYEDVFRVWECIWSAHVCFSKNFVLFIALALLKSYRNILIDRCMDYTDIIKFFNEMAERHDALQILELARVSVQTVSTLIQNE